MQFIKNSYYKYGRSNLINWIVFIIFLTFFYTPLLNNMIVAFGDVYRFPDILPSIFGFKWWKFVFGQDQLVSSITSSFIIATLTTIATLLVCIPAAYALARYRFKGRQGVMFTFLVSNAFPKMGIYVSMAILFYKMKLIGTVPGVIIVHMINSMMLMIMIPSASFRAIPLQQEEAARDIGAKPLTVFRKITLPQAMPGIIVASIYTFLGSLEEAQGTLLVGFPEISTMATAMYGVILDYPIQAGAVFSLILMLPSLVLIVIFRKYLSAKTLGEGFRM